MSRFTTLTGAGLLAAVTFTLVGAEDALACDFHVSPGGTLANTVTLGHANQTAGPGEVVCMEPGVYDGEFIDPLNSGNPSEPIVYQRHPGSEGEVEITNVTYCVRLHTDDWIVVRDITCDGGTACDGSQPTDVPWKGIFAVDSWHNTFENNVFRNIEKAGIHLQGCNGGSQCDPSNPRGSQFNTVRNNVVECIGYRVGHVGRAIEIQKESHFNLVEDNELGFTGHSTLTAQQNSTHGIFRRNAIYNPWHRGTLLGGGPNLYESNAVVAFSTDRDDPPVTPYWANMGISIHGSDNIVRKNYVVHGSGIPLNISPGSNPDLSGNRIYHNTIAHNEFPAIRVRDKAQAAVVLDDTVFMNNLIVNNSLNPPADDPDYPPGGTLSSTAQIYIKMTASDPVAKLTFRNNGIRADAAGALVVYNDTAAPQNSTLNAIDTKSQNNGGVCPSTWFCDNLEDDPDFVDPFALDGFRLKLGSPAIDAGASLTHVTEVIGPDEIRLADPTFFIDGFGISDGDEIELPGGAARILTLDYATGVATLDQAVNATVGDAVNLPYLGSAPDLGAAEKGAGSGCGLGMEISPLLVAAGWLRRRRRGRG
ncbi:MAG: right-handed parallel beta-helix repeat-containing protein [Proteobacteria bacterium]|nr:right-handed parallel beta-helix repeat-containing protein [Pseudomonadota bacterium]